MEYTSIQEKVRDIFIHEYYKFSTDFYPSIAAEFAKSGNKEKSDESQDILEFQPKLVQLYKKWLKQMFHSATKQHKR